MKEQLEKLLEAYVAAETLVYRMEVQDCEIEDCSACWALRAGAYRKFRDFRHNLSEIVLGLNPEDFEGRAGRERLHSYVMNYPFKLPAR